ncbi:hypothetical protein ACIBUY_16835 [Streptomyces sp. NPDC050085]
MPVATLAATNGREIRQKSVPNVVVLPMVSWIATWQIRPIFMY